MTDYKLPAGPELDRLIAEKVMGWKSRWMDRRYHYDDDGFSQTRAPSKEACRFNAIETFGEYDATEWNPSENIAHAWLIVEKLEMGVLPGRNDDWVAGYEDDSMINWYEHYMYNDEGTWCVAETAALAICRAALKSLTVKEN